MVLLHIVIWLYFCSLFTMEYYTRNYIYIYIQEVVLYLQYNIYNWENSIKQTRNKNIAIYTQL